MFKGILLKVISLWANFTSGMKIARGQYNTQKKSLSGKCIYWDKTGQSVNLSCSIDTAKNMVVPDGVKKAFGNHGATIMDGKDVVYLIYEGYPNTILLHKDLERDGWKLERTAMVFETIACELTDWLFTLIMRQHTKSQLITVAIAAFGMGSFITVVLMGMWR